MMLQSQAYVRDLFKVQNRSMNFNVAVYTKFIDMDSDSTLQLTLKHYHLLSFGGASKKNIHDYLKR